MLRQYGLRLFGCLRVAAILFEEQFGNRVRRYATCPGRKAGFKKRVLPGVS